MEDNKKEVENRQELNNKTKENKIKKNKINIKKARRYLTLRNFSIDIIQIIIGSLIMAFGTSAFLIPNKLSFGGVTGLATVLYYVFGFPIGNVVFIINIPLFILAYLKLGKGFCLKSVIGTFLLSLFYNIFEDFSGITGDKLLASITGGIIVGIGNVIVFSSHSSTGGSDIIVKYIKKKIPSFKTGTITAVIDTIIVSINVIFLKDIEIALYSAITIIALGKVVDTAYEGIGFSRTVYIISKKYAEIAKAINDEMQRGVTGLYSKGMYTDNENLMLLCVVGRNEIGHIRQIVDRIDNRAFMIISNTREVIGTGFS